MLKSDWSEDVKYFHIAVQVESSSGGNVNEVYIKAPGLTH